ncbi:MAG TPA: hypothetical protein VFQ25_11950 [Ktedonobacterales bacterium]|nr:hypothetical protein [Ktedonobacterales bacterium]
MTRYALLAACAGAQSAPSERRLRFAESDITELLLPWLLEDPAWRDGGDIALCGVSAPTTATSGVRQIADRHFLAELKRIVSHAEDDDFVLIYFSGHAVLREIRGVEKTCLEFPSTWVPIDEVRNTCRENMRGAAILLTLDCCYPISGDAEPEKSRLSRIISALGSLIQEADIERANSHHSGSLVYIGACLPGQESFESNREQSGYFLSAFIRGCDGGGESLPSVDGGVVTTGSLIQFIQCDLRGWQIPVAYSADPLGLRLKELSAWQGPRHDWNGPSHPIMLNSERCSRLGRKLMARSEFVVKSSAQPKWSTSQFLSTRDLFVQSCASVLPPLGARLTLEVGFTNQTLTFVEQCPAHLNPVEAEKGPRYLVESKPPVVMAEGAYNISLTEHKNHGHNEQLLVLSQHTPQPTLYVYRGLKTTLAIDDRAPRKLGPGTSSALHPASGRVFALDSGGALTVWPLEQSERAAPVSWAGHQASWMALSENAFAVAADGDSVYFWRLNSAWTQEIGLRALPQAPQGLGRIQALAAKSEKAVNSWAPGTHVAAGFGFGAVSQGALLLWNTEPGSNTQFSPPQLVATEHHSVDAIAFSDDGGRLAFAAGPIVRVKQRAKTGDYGRRQVVLDISDYIKTPPPPAGAPQLAITRLAFSPRIFAGSVLAIGTNYGDVLLWEYRRHRPPVSLPSDRALVQDLSIEAWNRYEARLIVRGAKSVEVWALATQRVARVR